MIEKRMSVTRQTKKKPPWKTVFDFAANSALNNLCGLLFYS